MAFAARYLCVVRVGIDAGDGAAIAPRGEEPGVASDAKLAAAVDGQLFRIFGMAESRPMAVFAGNYLVLGELIGSKLLLMAVTAGGGCLVFGWKIPPVLFVAQPVEAVHITPSVNAEILRHHEQSHHKNNGDETEYNEQRPPDMTFHAQRPFAEFYVVVLFKAAFSGLVKSGAAMELHSADPVYGNLHEPVQ